MSSFYISYYSVIIIIGFLSTFSVFIIIIVTLMIVISLLSLLLLLLLSFLPSLHFTHFLLPSVLLTIGFVFFFFFRIFPQHFFLFVRFSALFVGVMRLYFSMMLLRFVYFSRLVGGAAQVSVIFSLCSLVYLSCLSLYRFLSFVFSM